MNAVTTKRCNKCGIEKPISHFNKHKSNRDGLELRCKACRAEYDRQRHTVNREQDNERCRQYNAKNKEALAEYALQYRDEHRDDLRERHRQYRTQNRNALSKYFREWKDKNPDYFSRYNAENTDVVRAYQSRRRARVRGFPHEFGASDWQYAVDYFGGCCAVCGRQPGLWHTLAADHWIAVTSPDCPGTVPWNIVPLCHGNNGCNNSKHAQNAHEWLIERFGGKKGRAIEQRIKSYLDARRTETQGAGAGA